MKLPQIAFVAVAAAAVGFFLGRSSTAHDLTGQDIGANPPAKVHSTVESAMAEASSSEGKERQLSAAFTPETLKTLVLQLESGTLSAGARAQAWAEFYARLENSDLPALAAALAAANDEQLEPGVRAIYAAWAEKDPTAAWNSAVSFSVGGQCNKAMHAVLDAVGKNNPSAGLAMAQALENPSLREHMTSSALQTLAKSDPARAFDMALRSAERGDQSAFYSVLSQWVREDPAGAQRAVANLQGELGDQARLSVVQGLTEKDPEAAWNYALRLPPSTERYAYWDPRTRVIDLWSKKNPQNAIEAALTIDDQEIRNRAVASAIDNWASADFAAALAYVSNINDAGLRGSALLELSRNRGADPATMFEVLLEQSPAGNNFGNALSGLMSRWAKINPREAAAAILQLPAGDAMGDASRSLAEQWAGATSDKTEVLAWAQQLPPGNARDQALKAVFRTWSARDAGGAQAAWSTLAEQDREQMLSALTQGWSRTQPAEATRWAATLGNQPGSSEALNRALTAWTQSSPQEAAAFVQSTPEDRRSILTSYLINEWYSADPFAAAEWLKRQPAGPAKDSGISSISMQIAGENPETALAWAKSMTSQDSRVEQEKSILRRWMRNDPTQAAAWIRTSSLPAETKASLLSSTP